MLDDQRAPLQRMTFSSTDEDEVTAYIRRAYVGNRTTFATVNGSARLTAHHADSGSLGTSRLRSGIGYRCSTEPWDFFCSFHLDHGSARMSSLRSETQLRAGDSWAYPLGVPVSFDMAPLGARIVTLPMSRLDEAAEALGLVKGRLRLHGSRPGSPAMARYWRSLIGLVNGALLDDDSPMLGPLLREELARMTALAALHVFPNTTMSQHRTHESGHLAPATLRRAVAHVDDNAHLPLTLSDIADAAGTGVRALQQGFRRHLDTTPMVYLRRVRLERAHRELQAADPQRGDTVSAIAARWGFGSPSRFAAEHQATYGELPSQTLRT